MMQMEKQMEMEMEAKHPLIYPIKKANYMVQRTLFMLTAQEFDLLQYIIMKIKDDDMKLKPIEISINDYCKIANICANGKNYENIKKSLKSLRDKSVWIDDIEGKNSTLVSWIDAPIQIDYGTGIIKLKLSEFWEPYLLQLKENYTVTTLRETLPMKSVYGKRLYEILNSYLYSSSTYREFSIERLKKMLLGDQWEKKYKNFKDFHARVLKPALKDLSNYGELQVDMTLKKQGRAYSTVCFSIKHRNYKGRLQIADNTAQYFKPKAHQK